MAGASTQANKLNRFRIFFEIFSALNRNLACRIASSAQVFDVVEILGPGAGGFVLSNSALTK